MLGLMGFSASQAACPCTLFIDIISLFINWANKDACLLGAPLQTSQAHTPSALRRFVPPCLARCLWPLRRPSLCAVDILRYFRPRVQVQVSKLNK